MALLINGIENRDLTIRSAGSISKLGFWDLYTIGLPLLLASGTIFITGGTISAMKFILVVPVFMGATFYGQKVGALTGVVGAGFLLGIDVLYSGVNVLYPDALLGALIVAVGWVFGGITDTETAYINNLAERVNRDSLTNLYNHRHFHERLQQSLQAAKHSGEPLAVILADIDDFKFYNDAHGHLKGDRVIVRVSRCIEDAVTGIAPEAVVARYGGEKFGIILPGRSSREACKTAEAVRHKISATPFDGAEHQPNGCLTVFLGIAAYPEHADSADELLALADHALYKAKFGSKNRVEVYSSVFDQLYRSLESPERRILHSVKTLILVINAKDAYTYGHSERVVKYASDLGAAIGLDEKDRSNLAFAAYLHDIGKVEIDRKVLNKCGKLSKEEWQLMQQHPVWGGEIVRSIPFLASLAPVIRAHHENYDGTGYPDGLKGSDIPLQARILRIVDSFDAMVSDRPYSKGKSREEACREILGGAGKYYDPKLARVFVEEVVGYKSLNARQHFELRQIGSCG
ncbi:MAG: diguanylate cyclase [Peptococcaceae bacterium]|nr:diguanylate cyclase [Peptococcaceae bacterium]